MIKKQTIGIWDKGEGTELKNCSSEGCDIGLKSEGKNLVAENFKAIGAKISLAWHEKWWAKSILLPLFTAIVTAFIVYKLGFNN